MAEVVSLRSWRGGSIATAVCVLSDGRKAKAEVYSLGIKYASEKDEAIARERAIEKAFAKSVPK